MAVWWSLAICRLSSPKTGYFVSFYDDAMSSFLIKLSFYASACMDLRLWRQGPTAPESIHRWALSPISMMHTIGLSLVSDSPFNRQSYPTLHRINFFSRYLISDNQFERMSYWAWNVHAWFSMSVSISSSVSKSLSQSRFRVRVLVFVRVSCLCSCPFSC